MTNDTEERTEIIKIHGLELHCVSCNCNMGLLYTDSELKRHVYDLAETLKELKAKNICNDCYLKNNKKIVE